uniref:Small-conductance mechanosensitive channel n=1 Tax=uncultured Thiotrichaceae bacterium TaxID=298394 RepID=A0A6S6SVD8_9GAMM|nr:MAG: Small-conductance mechanosensitive channel [uncultured Thiotrichaceae bacterium]
MSDSLTVERKLMLILLWVIGWFLFIPTPALAADNTETQSPVALDWKDYIGQIEQAETRFKNNQSDKDTVKDTLATTTYAKTCISENEDKLQKVNDALETFGEAATNDAMAVPRRELSQQKEGVEKALAECRLLNLRGNDLLAQMQQAEQTALKERLFAKGPSSVEYSLGAVSQPLTLQQEAISIIQALSKLPLNQGNLYNALIYGVLGMLVGLFWNLHVRNDTKARLSTLEKTSPALATVWNSVIRVSPGLLLFGLIYLSFRFAPVDMDAANEIALTLLVFTISYTILRAMLKPQSHRKGFSPLIANAGRKLFYWWRFLLLTTLLGALFQSAIFDTEPPGNLVGLIRMGLGVLIGFSLMRVVWLLRKHLPIVKQLHLHFLSICVTLTAIVALAMGYTNFSVFLFKGLFGTFFILLLGGLLILIPVEIFDSMDEGSNDPSWQQRLRKRMDLEQDQIVPGLIWLRLVHVLVVGGIIIIALLRLWGMSEQSLDLVVANIISGYKIGEFTLEPLSILSGLLILSFGILLTQFIKRSLSRNWLNRTNLSRGAKEATVTITGYVGMTLAFFIGLSAAGINFANLAIIAGALSLGIGFGLQNIVNNFISGLILLFERPIRRGDWVRTATSEGYVKDISIRSTTIQTFDRADIIVPNSELISNQVTNMMLDNQFGRIIIPVRVAYGVDTEKVMDTLRSVAEIHPGVLREEGKLQIQVILRNFGETALNFELRVHIRDVENVLLITSELNLAIDKAFRKVGIKMPLPSQVVLLEKQASRSCRKADSAVNQLKCGVSQK